MDNEGRGVKSRHLSFHPRTVAFIDSQLYSSRSYQTRLQPSSRQQMSHRARQP